MQDQTKETQMTLDDLYSFNSFNPFQIEDLISEKESIEENEPNEDQNNEVNLEEEETEAMKKLRNFPNVAFSRFNFQNNTEQTDNTQSPHSSPKQETHMKPTLEKRSPLMRGSQPKFAQSFGQFKPHYTNNNTKQQNPLMSTSTTQHSSITNSLFPNDTFHNSMPIQSCYMPYYNYQIPYNVTKRGSVPIQPIFNNSNVNYSMNYYNPNNTSMNNFSINSMNNYFNMTNTNTNTTTPIEKKQRANSSIEEFNTLEELQSSLKGGKQIGNYIKSRNNLNTMTNLIKKLPSDKIGELIELIKSKLKDIMISNNKFSQKLFDQCTAEQRVIILNAIKDNFIEIALNKWGSFSLQSLIKIVSLPEEQEIIKNCIKGKVYELAMDKQANFVLQKLILLLNEKGMASITDEIFDIFNHLIYNSTGIGLLKNLVLTNKGSDTRKKFVQKVNDNLSTMINNQTGSSLLIQMMEKWDFETCRSMITEIIKDITKYASMKYSASVVLKLITIADNKTIKGIYTLLFQSEGIMQIMKTDYGREIIKELFVKLSKKQRVEAYAMLEATLAVIQNKNRSMSVLMPDFIMKLLV